MAYTKQTGIPCGNAETVVQLADDSDYVAVQCAATRDPASNMMQFVPQARWIDNTGAAKTDGSGNPVATVKTLSMSPDDVTRLGADVVTKECLLLVLGEPLTPDPNNAGLTIIPWSADLVAQCSIRNAISAASVNAPAASAVL